MFPSQTTYPQFAPNQVLSNRHLNELFNYLDEQERLTRTHLIGIGIVCGLEAETAEGDEGFGLLISPGCGVTSEGYLIRWEEDEVLEFRAPYTMPEDIDYTFFDLPDGSGTYPMWELTTDRNDNPDAQQLSEDFLTGVDQIEGEGDEKVLLLLLECRTQDNRNCTPNNCDDKGKTVETAVRPLLIRRGDLEEIRRVLSLEVEGVAEYYSLYASRASRLNLPSMRAPRFDVLNTNPVSTRDVYEAYQRMLSAGFLATVQSGLDEAYTALQPIATGYESNPFASRVSGMTFLHDGRMLEGREALGYQYYYDHLVTILQAYEELREKAEELFSLCCPDGRIFPRHLVLHHFDETGIRNDLRHNWVSSPAQNQQTEARAELLSLFDRLVELVGGTELPIPAAAVVTGPDSFTAEPVSVARVPGRRRRRRSAAASFSSVADGASFLAAEGINSVSFSQGFSSMLERRFVASEASIARDRFRIAPLLPIRITPSFLGQPLSKKAIPYYYDPTNLLALWNFQLTQRGKEDENLGFDAIDWNSTDDFVRQPLRYDLEPRKFLRIEGAIGQNYLQVGQEIQRQINTYRLPIDLLALRTGSMTDDLEIEDYDIQFADLEADYCQWRERMLGRLAEICSRIYDVQRLDNQVQVNNLVAVGSPQAPLVSRLEGYTYAQDTLGEFYEQNLASHTDDNPFLQGISLAYFLQLIIIHYLVRTESFFPESFRDLDIEAADNRLLALQSGARGLARLTGRVYNDAHPNQPAPNNFLDVEEYLDQLDILLSSGDFSAFRKLVRIYNERREEILQRQLLSVFQEEHPGLQFKAGTELGGTFVLVYHGDGVVNVPPRSGRFRLVGQVVQDGETVIGATVVVVGTSFGTTTDIDGRFSLFTTQLPVQIRVNQVGAASRTLWVTTEEGFLTIDLNDENPVDTDQPIPGITAGTVIADFYLPYRCCGKGSPVHIFPPALTEEPVEALVASTEQISCTTQVAGANFSTASFQFAISGGTAPYQLIDSVGNMQAIADGDIVQITGGGDLTIQDADGQTVPLEISLAPPLNVVLNPEPQCINDNTEVIRRFQVFGGRPPYSFNAPDGSEVTLAENAIGEVTLDSGQVFALRVVDQFGDGCEAQITIPAFVCEDEVGCQLPCEGIATRASFPLWAQRPANNSIEYVEFNIEFLRVSLNPTDSTQFELSASDLSNLNNDLAANLGAIGSLTSANYSAAMTAVVNTLMTHVDPSINQALNLENGIRALAFTASAPGRYNRLTVDYFPCQHWEMEMRVSYFEGGSNGIFRERSVRYSDDAMDISVRSNNQVDEAKINSFDRFRLDLCDPTSPPVPSCEEEKSISVSREGNNLFANGANAIDQFFWEVALAVPTIGNQDQMLLESPFDTNIFVATLLVVDPETGCFAITRNRIVL